MARRPEFLGTAAIPVREAVVVKAVRKFTTLAEPPRAVGAASAVGADDAVVRATGILGLGAVAVIHFSQVVSTFDETPWLGAAFMVLTVACMVVAGQLLRRGSRLVWAQVAAVNLAAIVGYIFTRLFSTPFDNGDVGNWSEMLGLSALFVEGTLVALSVWILAGTPAGPRRNSQTVEGRSFGHLNAAGSGEPTPSLALAFRGGDRSAVEEKREDLGATALSRRIRRPGVRQWRPLGLP